jgi:hypothetical protein
MRLRALKALLWLVCTTHLGLGLAGMLSPAWATRMVQTFYGARLDLTPVLIHVLRIVGAYMVAIGVLGGLAARDPARHRAVVMTIAGMLLIRVLQRLMHAGEIEVTFGVSAGHLWFQSVYFAVLAGALVALLPRKPA